jgi:hypothetical protein
MGAEINDFIENIALITVFQLHGYLHLIKEIPAQGRE